MDQRIDRDRLAALLLIEEERFAEDHPTSRDLAARASNSLLGGVPMNWMACWPGRFPVFAAEASGARVVDVDGHEYIDFCLGDTGAMTGHSPAATVEVIAEQARRGISLMLPTEDSPIVGEELARRFGLPLWQIASSATDANRFALRLARQATDRQKILVFDWCYHGTVDETLVTLDEDGNVQPREGRMGPPVDPALTTKAVAFNDLDALEAALAPRDVACVLAEPAMTNIGIIHPEPGYLEAVRELTRTTGTLLIIDETHTICAGPGGYTQAYGLEPDLLTIGKPIASGLPTAAYGMTHEVADRVRPAATGSEGDVSGIGGTLAGNALALAAMRVTLADVLTDEAFAHTLPLGARWEAGVQSVIDSRNVPWSVTRLGARAEYWFLPERPRHGAEAAAGVDEELDGFMHLYALNRGILLTPFHNMALMSPDTTDADVDRHTEVFAAAVDELLGVIDEDRLRTAVAGASARDSAGPRDMAGYLNGILSFQSHRELLGPYRDGSGPSGVVVHRGARVAEWGDPAVVEMSFSATKTYLSVVAGVAFDRGLIPDVHAPVGGTVDDPAFDGPRSWLITWDHLLRQTSQWDGTLWDLPWWADPQGGQARDADLGAPGSAFAYNDVRINLLALALTRLFRESLADVLRREVMGPIGASDSWEWHGYRSSVVEIDGRPVESVSGGAHWGGGLWMSALDHSRLGRLYLARGRWDGEPVISEEWIDASLSPADTNPDYGMLWWLNHRGRIFPDAPRTGFCARGNLGRQLLWVDPARDLVVVSRWSDDVGTLLAEVSAAIEP